MAYNVREMLNSFSVGLKDYSMVNKEHVNSFMSLLGTAYKPQTVDVKIKELISVAIGCYNRCEYCIVYHVYKAYEAGATKEQIYEAAMVAVAFGGGPSMAYLVTLVKDCVNEFEKDFKR